MPAISHMTMCVRVCACVHQHVRATPQHLLRSEKRLLPALQCCSSVAPLRSNPRQESAFATIASFVLHGTSRACTRAVQSFFPSTRKAIAVTADQGQHGFATWRAWCG